MMSDEIDDRKRAADSSVPGLGASRAKHSEQSPIVELQVRIFGPAQVSYRGEFHVHSNLKAPPTCKTELSSADLVVSEDTGFRVANGRKLPPLLFVTDTFRLAQNLGVQECRTLLEAIRNSELKIVDVSNASGGFADVASCVHKELRASVDVVGVVILGGYSVVPAATLDCLPAELRSKLPRDTADADNFIIWNDDVFGDRDGDGFPEVPVSRIPDGRLASLLLSSLAAPSNASYQFKSGIRNRERPLAEEPFAGMPGKGPLLVSEPVGWQEASSLENFPELVYYWLHGNWAEPDKFWGERTSGELLEVVNLTSVKAAKGQIIFAACCWGALIVDTPAARVSRGAIAGALGADASIALAFLRSGANAFVGCTGSHYNPIGLGLHTLFWQHVAKGESPAVALFKAKMDFAKGIPHGQTDPKMIAIEYKTFWEFTCLGLGW